MKDGVYFKFFFSNNKMTKIRKRIIRERSERPLFYSIKVQIREQSERRRAEPSRPRSNLSVVDFVFDLDRDTVIKKILSFS